MADGVPEVQVPPVPTVKLVARNEVPLHRNAALHDRFIARGYRLLAQRLEETLVPDHTVLDYLRAPAAHLALGQRGEGIRIADHRGGLVEAAELVFPRAQVYRRLTADGGIHRRKQRRRQLDVIHAAPVGRRGKASHISDHAAAERNNKTLA